MFFLKLKKLSKNKNNKIWKSNKVVKKKVKAKVEIACNNK